MRSRKYAIFRRHKVSYENDYANDCSLSDIHDKRSPIFAGSDAVIYLYIIIDYYIQCVWCLSMTG